MMAENKCLNCGYCCHFYADGEWHKCKYLKIFANNKSKCKIYFRPNRVGIQIYKDKKGKIFRCSLREKFKHNYPNCPYNKDGQEMIKPESY